jgi:hypothetical protein
VLWEGVWTISVHSRAAIALAQPVADLVESKALKNGQALSTYDTLN